MDGARGDASTGIRAVLRVGIAALLLGPGLNKFLTYGRSVRLFETLGLPVPAVLVLVVGTVEIAVAVFLLLDRVPRAAAVTVIPVMVGAAVTAGPTWQNVGVFVAAIAIVWIDTEQELRHAFDAMIP